MKLPKDQERFRTEHTILAKREQMEKLIARHNYLMSVLPKVIDSDAVVATFEITRAEIGENMKALQQVMTELERDCSRSKYFSKQARDESE
jgi:DNA-directed RNA polymerase subunit H (RpoH/RPB5)